MWMHSEWEIAVIPESLFKKRPWSLAAMAARNAGALIDMQAM